MRYQGTDIDGPMVDPDGLMVRGLDLAGIMGNKTFLECFFLTMYGEFPSENQLAELNRYFDDSFRSIEADDAAFQIIPQVATTPEFSLNGLIAGLAIDRQQKIKAIPKPDFGDIEVTDIAADGFYFMSILPILSGFSAASPVVKNTDQLLSRFEEAKKTKYDHIDRISVFFRGKPFKDADEKKLFESVLIAFCAGFGYLTPSIMTPRISIGSGVSVGLAIVSSCTTAGPWHLGTSQDVIIMFQEMLKERNGRSTEEYVEFYVNNKFDTGEKLLGFGHPFFKKDPRVLRLVEIMNEIGFKHETIDLFHCVTNSVEKIKSIYPNLETAHGAIMTSIGFDIPFLGPSVALIGRSGGMIAHIEERLTKPAFGVRNNVARNFFDKVPMGWL